MDTIITIDAHSIKKSENLEAWIKLNEDFLVSLIPDKDGKLFFSLEKYISQEGPENWVTENGKYVIYEESRHAIENIHTIDTGSPENLDEAIEHEFKYGNNKERVSVAEMIKRGYEFDLTTYENHMILKLEENNLSPAVKGKYNKNLYCFSYPFCKSILQNNNESKRNECYFNFVEITIGKRKALAFFVEFSDKTKSKKYYDYSQNPPKSMLEPVLTINTSTTSDPRGNMFSQKLENLRIQRALSLKGLDRQF